MEEGKQEFLNFYTAEEEGGFQGNTARINWERQNQDKMALVHICLFTQSKAKLEYISNQGLENTEHSTDEDKETIKKVKKEAASLVEDADALLDQIKLIKSEVVYDTQNSLELAEIHTSIINIEKQVDRINDPSKSITTDADETTLGTGWIPGKNSDPSQEQEIFKDNLSKLTKGINGIQNSFEKLKTKFTPLAEQAAARAAAAQAATAQAAAAQAAAVAEGAPAAVAGAAEVEAKKAAAVAVAEKEKVEKEAQEKAKKEAAAQAAKEKAEKEKEKEAKEQAEKEAKEQAEKEAAAQEAARKKAQEKAEKEAAREKARKEAQEKAKKEAARKEAEEAAAQAEAAAVAVAVAAAEKAAAAAAQAAKKEKEKILSTIRNIKDKTQPKDIKTILNVLEAVKIILNITPNIVPETLKSKIKKLNTADDNRIESILNELIKPTKGKTEILKDLKNIHYMSCLFATIHASGNKNFECIYTSIISYCSLGDKTKVDEDKEEIEKQKIFKTLEKNFRSNNCYYIASCFSCFNTTASDDEHGQEKPLLTRNIDNRTQ